MQVPGGQYSPQPMHRRPAPKSGAATVKTLLTIRGGNLENSRFRTFLSMASNAAICISILWLPFGGVEINRSK